MGAYDLTNRRFGNLVAKKVAYRDDSGHNFWECHCDCGAVVFVRPLSLLNGKTTMCKKCKKNNMQANIDVIKNDNFINVDKIDDNIDEYDNIHELSGADIFTAPIIFQIVHAINADLSSKEFKNNGELTMAGELNKFFKIYDELDELSALDWGIGEVIHTTPVYHLITKKDRYDKVTYENLEKCLYSLKSMAESQGNFYLAFPKICCGQDKLEWKKVKHLIVEIFKDTDFQIMLF